MDELESRYINPYTDYGFKYLFGTEPNKDITLAFINALLQGEEVIKSLTLLPAEQLGDTQEDRRAVFTTFQFHAGQCRHGLGNRSGAIRCGLIRFGLYA